MASVKRFQKFNVDLKFCDAWKIINYLNLPLFIVLFIPRSVIVVLPVPGSPFYNCNEVNSGSGILEAMNTDLIDL